MVVGFFRIEGYCSSDLTLTFSNTGFMPVTVDVAGTSGQLDVFIQLIGLLLNIFFI